MVKLIEGNNVSLAGPRKLGGKDYIEIPAIGDGNCALNSFALGLIDLIKRNQLVLKDAEKQQQLMEQIYASLGVLEDRLYFYQTGEGRGVVSGSGNAYSDLAHSLEEFITFVADKPDYDQLVSYIDAIANTREQIAALHIALAPALRSIGVGLYQEQMSAIASDDEDMLADAKSLSADGEHVGHDVLAPLAHDFFQVNLNMYSKDESRTLDPVTGIPGAPEINVLHLGDHWNYLIDADQDDGLAAVLNEDFSYLLEETDSLVQVEGKHANDFTSKPETIEPVLGDVVQVVKKAGANLLVMGEVKNDEEYNRLSEDHSKHSSSILESVRKHVDLSDENLKSLKLSQLEKDLLLGNVEEAEAITDDARLARALQDAEILHFFSAKHSTFFGSRDVKHAAEKKEEVDHKPNFKPE